MWTTCLCVCVWLEHSLFTCHILLLRSPFHTLVWLISEIIFFLCLSEPSMNDSVRKHLNAFSVLLQCYFLLLLQSALQPLVRFRPAQLSLSILSRKVLQSALASGTSNPPTWRTRDLERSNFRHKRPPASEATLVNPAAKGETMGENFAESGDFHITFGFFYTP
jgi:hypothetical protein